MRVLVIGCGYVGLALGRELLRRGHEVSGLRRDPTGLEAEGIRPVAADISRPETLAPLAGDYDWVANCAASSVGGPEDYRRVYLEGTVNILRWLAPHPPKKYVYTSSTGVYGQNDGSLVEETSPAEPPSETGRVLVQTETLLREAVRTQGFPAVVLRLSGIYGPDRGYWFKQFLSGQAVMEGQGERVLNMVHRDDVAGAMVAALERGRPGEIYNVSDSEPVTQRAMFEWLAAELGRPLPPSVPENPEAIRGRGVTQKRISNRKLRAELGYEFKYPSFREGYRGMAASGRGSSG